MSAAQIKSLTSELASLQELLPQLSQTAKTTAPGVSQCPSRLHPSKPAKDVSAVTETDYVGLLELTIDRLQYLIQCVVCVLGSQSPPLSLSSAVKKLSQLLTRRDTTPSSQDNPVTFPLANNSTHKSIASQTYETAFANCLNSLQRRFSFSDSTLRTQHGSRPIREVLSQTADLMLELISSVPLLFSIE